MFFIIFFKNHLLLKIILWLLRSIWLPGVHCILDLLRLNLCIVIHKFVHCHIVCVFPLSLCIFKIWFLNRFPTQIWIGMKLAGVSGFHITGYWCITAFWRKIWIVIGSFSRILSNIVKSSLTRMPQHNLKITI